jgi:hypothetical protein
VRIEKLEEAIKEVTGACPHWDTIEPCLSDWCLTLREALNENLVHYQGVEIEFGLYK